MRLPIMPPVKPMLAKPVKNLPTGDYGYEPKWDGFRSILFKDGDEVELGSRRERPLTRYFPELVAAASALPARCVLDGEIIVIGAAGDRLDFEALQQRIHPADSRVELLSHRTPACFVAFDLLAYDDTDFTPRPLRDRRRALEAALADAGHPWYPTPQTTDPHRARQWFTRFEGAGLDGIVAKDLAGPYLPDKRVMFKLKHERTADCVVAGYRTHKSGPDRIGSLLLGIHDENGELINVGVIGAFPAARRRELFDELQPLVTDLADHPWSPRKQAAGTRTPTEAEHSRWSAGKDLSFTPLRPERVVEVRYDHLEGIRFRHTAQFVRWRPDRDPASCTYRQLDEPVSFDLAEVLSER